MFVPNLSRLAHRPSPTGVDPPRTRARARDAQAAAQGEVLGNSDLLAQILAALNTEFEPDDACAMVMSYCAAQRDACAEDTWRALLALVFPAYGGPLSTPKAKFLALCRRWDRGRLFRYEHDLVLHGRMVPGGLVPTAHLARIMDWFKDAHNVTTANFIGYNTYLSSLPPGHNNYAVWYLLDFLVMGDWDKIRQMLQGGLIHVSNVFAAPPMNVSYNRFEAFSFNNWGGSNSTSTRLGNPYTLLGILLVIKEKPEKVETLLRAYGADPNVKFASVEKLSFGGYVVPEEDLNYDDEGAAECLALRHIYAIMGRKLTRQYLKHLNMDDVNPFAENTLMDSGGLVWYDKPVPSQFQRPGNTTIVGERSTMLSYYRLLYQYGGDVYNAAMMYRAYGETFHEFYARDMAEQIEKFARFVTTANDTVPVTDALRAQLLAKHLARLRRRDPYYRAPDFKPDWDDDHSTDDEDDAAKLFGGNGDGR